jgi:hypothetical protein
MTMRRIGLAVALAAATLGGQALADDVYSWKDRSGVQHFGNAPTAGATQTGIAHAPDTFESTADDEGGWADGAQNTGQGLGADGGFAVSDGAPPAGELSAADDLKRLRVGKELRTMSQRITAIDGELAKLASIRTRFAAGTPETGGLGTNAEGYLSPEEKALVAERDQLLKDQARLQKELSSLGSGSNPAEQEILVDDAAAVAAEPADPVE